MELTKERFEELTEAVRQQASAINAKSDRHNYNVTECAKNGTTQTLISMIVELESTARVLKRRLIATLPAEEQSEHSPV